MISHLDRNDGRYTTLINKINELIDTVNGLTKGKDHYDPQAEEALKQIAELEHRFDEHSHTHPYFQHNSEQKLVSKPIQATDQETGDKHEA